MYPRLRPPQRGQTKPFGHRCAVRCSPHRTSSPKRERNSLTVMMGFRFNGLEQFHRRCIVDCGETLRQTDNGEIVWGRPAAQAAAGPRPWGRNTRTTGGALLGERAVGMEDLRPA